MNSKKILASMLAATVATSCMSGVVAPPVYAQAQDKNVIFILADDLGWMDTALNGSTYYETPNIQRLAREGITFTNAYAHPLCSPTRSSILTGQYPHRTGINAPAGHLPDNSSNFTFDPSTTAPYLSYVPKNSLNGLPTYLYTIGQAYKDNGYRTGIMGKIHLGIESQFQMINRGFDVDLGMPVSGPESYYSPYFPSKPGNVYDNGSLVKNGEYITDRLAREADKFITDNKNTPFLLEMWDFSVHSPFEGKKEYIDYFQKKNVPSSPQNGNFHMAAMLKSMDDALGKVLDSVEKNGLTDKTMIVFMGDNGGNEYSSIDNHTPTNNYPLRQGKATVYEGGIRVPCVVKVPNVTTPGSICRENINAVDFYPTLLDYAGITNPNLAVGQVLDGMSIMPLLSGVQQTLNRPGVFTNFIADVEDAGNTSATCINSGKWKLIINYELMGGLKQKYELYDLESNISETINLASQYPAKVTELEGYINQHLIDIPQAKPKINPIYNAAAEIPLAYKAWDNWVKEFSQKVANDTTIIGQYPKTVLSDNCTVFYEKIKNSLVLKVDKFGTISNKYDDKIENNNTPKIISDIKYIPLKYVAEKFGFTYSQTVDTATIMKDNIVTTLKENLANVNGQDVILSNYPVIVNNVFMLPLDAVQTILGKNATYYSNGIIIVDDIQVALTSDELAFASSYIDSFNLYESAYWNANTTLSMVEKAQYDADLAKYTVPPAYMGNSVMSWNFDTTTEGFAQSVPTNGPLTQENGNLKLTVNSTDTYIFSPTVSLDASKACILKFRYKNMSAGTLMQVFWITSTDGTYNSTKRIDAVPIVANMLDYQTWYIDLSQSAAWSGTITQFRLDCIDNASSGSILYDSIEILEKNNPIINKWNFSTGNDGWYPQSNLTFDTSTNGILACNILSTRAYMTLSGVNIPSDEYQLVKVRVKNATAASVIQVYFETDTASYSESTQRAVSMMPNMSDYQDVYIDMSAVNTWTGKIKSLRLDPADNATNGTVYIDSIEVVRTKPYNEIYFDGFSSYSTIADMASTGASSKPWAEYQKSNVNSAITSNKKLSLTGSASGAKVHYAKQLDSTKLASKKFSVSFDVKTDTQNIFNAYLASNVLTDRRLVPLVSLTKNSGTSAQSTLLNNTATNWELTQGYSNAADVTGGVELTGGTAFGDRVSYKDDVNISQEVSFDIQYSQQALSASGWIAFTFGINNASFNDNTKGVTFLLYKRTASAIQCREGTASWYNFAFDGSVNTMKVKKGTTGWELYLKNSVVTSFTLIGTVLFTKVSASIFANDMSKLQILAYDTVNSPIKYKISNLANVVPRNNLSVMGTVINDSTNIWEINTNYNIKMFVDNTGVKPFVSEVWLKNTDTQVVKKYYQSGGYVYSIPTATPDSDKLGEIRLCMENGATGNSITLDNLAVFETVGVNEGITYNSSSGAKIINFNDGTATLNGLPFENGSSVIATGNYQIIITAASNSPQIINFSYAKYGDVSGDGNITVIDLIKIKVHILKISELTGVYKTAGDIYNAGKITISDLLAVKKHLLKISLIT